MLESELQRKKELVARICVALKRRQEKMIKARSRFKHMARSLYWSVIWPSITSRYKTPYPQLYKPLQTLPDPSAVKYGSVASAHHEQPAALPHHLQLRHLR